MKQTEQQHVVYLLGIILIVLLACVRLLPTIEVPLIGSLTPFGAIAILASMLFATKKLYAYLVPLALYAFTDTFLLYVMYPQHQNKIFLYDGWYWVYLTLLVAVWIGLRVMKDIDSNRIIYRIIGTCGLVTFVHFSITNFGVWVQGGCVATTPIYPATILGLINVYINGLPYAVSMMVSTTLLLSPMYILFTWTQKKVNTHTHSIAMHR